MAHDYEETKPSTISAPTTRAPNPADIDLTNSAINQNPPATRPVFDFFEEDDNFSDNPLAQSSTAQPVLNNELVAAVSTAIRSANTFNLNQDDLFEEEADYAEDDDEEDEDDEDDDDELKSGPLFSNLSDNAISRQSSSADMTNNMTSDTTSVDRRIEYFEVEREDDEDEEENEDDDEYGDDFNDNFVDYVNVDRRTLIKELVNASNALAASSAKPPAASNPNNDFVSFTTSSLSDNTGRDTIYQDLMSTISAAASTISSRLQNQISTSSTNSLNTNQPQSVQTDAASKPKETETKLSASKTRTSKGKTSEMDSADEPDLNSQLCSFTITKKEFMNQHWYYCHTCKMIDRIGMCSVCAKVCHKGHDISYAKYGSFFCDCGAKEDGSCQALDKRKSSNTPKPLGDGKKGSKFNLSKNLKKKSGLPNNGKFDPKSLNSKNFLANNIPVTNAIELLRRVNTQINVNKPKQLEKIRQQLIDCIKSKDLVKTIRRLLDDVLIPMARDVYDDSLLNTNSLTARRLMSKFKTRKFIMPKDATRTESNGEILVLSFILWDLIQNAEF